MSATAIVLTLLAIVSGVLAAVVKTLITDEVKWWLPHASRKLVNRAVDLLPSEHQDRWREEWEADLAKYVEDERRLAGLQYAVQALRASTAMRKTLRPALEPSGPAEPAEQANPHFSIASSFGPLILAALMIGISGDPRYAFFMLLTPLIAMGSYFESRRRASKRGA